MMKGGEDEDDASLPDIIRECSKSCLISLLGVLLPSIGKSAADEEEYLERGAEG